MTDPLRRKRDESGTATSGVADELVRMILGLPPGSSLPSEAELALQHGVSRVTVREAVKMVAGRGLLELARGRRAVVREPDAAALGQFVSSITQNDSDGFLQLVEARMSLEVQCAGLAAMRATQEDTAEIGETVRTMETAVASADRAAAEGDFHAADVRFHRLIAQASRNRILIGMFGAIAPAFEQSLFLTRKEGAARDEAWRQTVHAHHRILNCIETGDQAGAEAAMRVHVSDALRDVRVALGLGR
ncbi:MAG TPA: FadR/GntR family transcriptional regulator [Devosia sp.]|nr:FadR/GntR family transcriptional regulator [Devosia sp.]